MVRRLKCYFLVAAVLFATILSSCSGADSVLSESAESPLDELFSAAWEMELSPEELRRQLEARDLKWDELVADCMHRAGFQYLPRTPEGWGMDPRQVAYMYSLSETEFEAWWEAYQGPPPYPDTIDSIATETIEDRGCQWWADNELASELQPVIPDEFIGLFAAIEQLQASILLKPEFVALDSEWAYCMALAGFPNLERPDVIISANNAVTDFDLANLKCQTHLDYEARVREFVFEAENQFMADYRHEIDAFLTYSAQSRS